MTQKTQIIHRENQQKNTKIHKIYKKLQKSQKWKNKSKRKQIISKYNYPENKN